MWRSGCWSWIFQHFLQYINILTYIPQLVAFDLDSWKFIIDLWVNPNPTCLSVLYFFYFLNDLKNINMVVKQLQKTNASTGSKKMKYHVAWTIKRSFQLTFFCYISSSCSSFISSYWILRCSVQFQPANFCFNLLKTDLPKTKNTIRITFSSEC